MGLFASMYRFGVMSVVRNPTGFAGTLLFGLGFSLVAGNAIFSQQVVHPDPFWNTTDAVVTRSLEKQEIASTETTEPERQSITRSVLTQRISLTNVPVPTLKPVLQPAAGTQTELVRETQQALAELGLYKGKVDGIFGSGTKASIVAFQESAQILPDGAVSYELLKSIRTAGAVSKRVAEIQTAVPKTVRTPEPVVISGAPKVKLAQPKPSAFDREMVVRIQTGLKERFGEADIDVDGVYGDQTRNALMRFQAFFDLDPTGEIDAKTLEKLLSAGVIQAI